MSSNPFVTDPLANPRIKTVRNGRLFHKSTRRAVIYDWHLERSGKAAIRTNKFVDTTELKRKAERRHYWEMHGLSNDLTDVLETNVCTDALDRHVDRPKIFGDPVTDKYLWRARIHLGHAETCCDPTCCAADPDDVDDFDDANAVRARIDRYSPRLHTEPCVVAVSPKFNKRTGAHYVVDRETRLVEKVGRNAVRKSGYTSDNDPPKKQQQQQQQHRR